MYWAPVLAIINSREFRNLTEHVSTSHASILLPMIFVILCRIGILRETLSIDGNPFSHNPVLIETTVDS